MPTTHHHHHSHSHQGAIIDRILKVEDRGPRNGVAAYAYAVRKYGFTTKYYSGKQGQVFKIASDGSSAEVPADNVQNDLEYVVPVTIGTPGVTLNLDFDTGSSDLWVWSSNIKTSTKGHTIYNPAKSTTSKVLSGAKWSITYGDGSSASGNVYTDTIKLGTISIPNQAVELASKLSSAFQQDGSDGLLGLAWPSLNTVTPTPQKTPVENLIDQGIITEDVFTACLDKGDSNGFYTFGVIDATKAGVSASAIAYTPINTSQGFWQFNSTSATVNGKTIALASNTAIADTGTTLALVSDTLVNAIYAAIPGAKQDATYGGWIYPTNAKIPTVQFAVGTNLYTISANNFTYSPAEAGYNFGGIQSRGDNPFDIFGDVFLKNVYVVFDQGATRIGMAQRSD